VIKINETPLSYFKQIQEKPLSLSEKIMAQIKNSISQGQLKPGDKLPGERDLSQRLGVSRTSLREALKSLEATGIVEIKHGQGVFIKDNDPESIFKFYLTNLHIDKKKLQDLFSIRNVLEAQAVEWACMYGSDEELQSIKNLVLETRKKIEKSPEILTLLADSDAKFHNLIFEASHNYVLKDIMNNLLDLLFDARIQSAKKGRNLKSIDEHLVIANALLDRNIEKARQAMQSHLYEVKKDILD